MRTTLPGTVIPVSALSEDSASDALRTLFAAGGIVLSQVTALTGLESYTVQNWVKRGFVSPPKRRQYSERQFCRIVIINMLRQTMQLDAITALLSYINGALDDESDDRIDDAVLYRFFVRQLALLESRALTDEDVAIAASDVTKDFREIVPDSRRRIGQVLTVMTYAYRAAELHSHTEELLRTLN